MPLFGTNGVVSGSCKPLPGIRSGRNSVNRITGSQAKGDTLGGEHSVSFAMDGGECDELSGVKEANGRIDIRDRL